MQTINVTIVVRDSVVAVGLKYLLCNLFDIEARVCNSADALKNDDANADLYIADSEQFAAYPGFFIPRRMKLLVLSDRDECDDGTGYLLNRYASEPELVKQLTKAVEQARETKNTGNDLSVREIDVLCLVARGLTNKEIADKLNISVNTVLSHRKNITSKLGIRSVSGLSVYAMMNGYINSVPSGI